MFKDFLNAIGLRMTYFVKQKWTDFQYLYAKSYKTGIPKGLGYVIAAKSISTKVLTQGGE